MKIIKQGKLKEEAGTKIVCTNCNSELEFSNQDIVKVKNIEKDIGLKSFVLCPVCSNSINVE